MEPQKIQMEILVSVIVPVYRSDRIRRCIESVLKQSYPVWELILVDDGSTDGAGKICDEYAAEDSRIRVIHQKNRGISAARNTGLDHCRGEVLYFIDDDDYVHPDLIGNSLQKMEQEEADMVCFYAAELRGGKRKNLMEWSYADPSWNAGQIREKGLCFRLLMVWSKAYRRELWEQLRFPEGQAAEDVWITVPLWKSAKKICVLPQILYFYDQSPHGSVTQQWTAGQDYDACASYTNCMQDLAAWGESDDARLPGLYRLYRLRAAVTGLYNNRKNPVLSEEQKMVLEQVMKEENLSPSQAEPILSNDLYFRILEEEQHMAGKRFPGERRERMLRCAIQACCMDWAEPRLEPQERQRLENFIDQWKGGMKKNEKILQWCIRHHFQMIVEQEGRRLMQKFSKV